jgi:CRP-like cAMP-binding protein
MITIMSPELFDALAALATRRITRPAGAALFHQRDPVAEVFLLTAGHAELRRHQADGALVVLHRAGPGDMLAEASLYAARYHCDGVCTAPAEIAAAPRGAVRACLEGNPAHGAAWAAHLARTLQATRHRAELLTRRTVAARLDGWLDWHGGALPARGRWRGLAEELGVTPEALYRELARRKGGGAGGKDGL